ncbi:MAG: hypothetical protein EXS38_02500 [Opitutus sp.]|nr:hypothetical protein [Opitutus sp.]
MFEKYGFEARVAMSFNSPYMTAVGVNGDSDTYTNRRHPIDAKASYRINKRLKVFVEGTNLSEQPLKEFVGNASRCAGNEIYHWKARFGGDFSLEAKPGATAGLARSPLRDRLCENSKKYSFCHSSLRSE